MNRIIQVLLAIALLGSSASAQGDAMRAHPWLPPAAAQLGSPKDQQWRDADPTRYLTLSGDFDGDGKPDEARILVRGDGKAFALFVKLAAREAPLKLDEFPGIEMLPVIGIKRVAPATYPTACARGIDCAEDEPRYIRVNHDAIDFFKVETADTYYYWNDSRHAFVRAGISD